MAESARIRLIKVTNLFGIFNHEIELKLRDRITILHGPNGYGKTIILKMLQALFSGRWDHLRAIPFDEFAVEFEDAGVVQVSQKQKETKNKKPSKVRSFQVLEVTFISRPGSVRQTFLFDNSEIITQQHIPYGLIASLLPFIMRAGPDEWVDGRTGEKLNSNELTARFSEELSIITKSYAGVSNNTKEPEWLKVVRECIRLHLIHTQRLNVIDKHRHTEKRPAHDLTVEKYSEEIARDIKTTLTKYASRSQELDSSFLERLFQQDQGALLPIEVLQERLSKIEAKRAQLIALGFLDPERDTHKPPPRLDPTKLDVLFVYVHDTESKLAVFDEMAQKVQLLTDAINKRFKYKRMSISKDKGFIFKSVASSSPLPLGSLSSGEQHELVLFYELLFKVQPNALVLIDEPEISLHLAWQQQFLGDLVEIVKLSDIDVLLATHAPGIIGKRWDLTVELKGPDLVETAPA